MQAEVMSLRGNQWLQLFHEQAQSGHTVARWCREHHVASSIYYRRKNALREELLEEMETEQRQPNLSATVTDSQSEPQFAALAHARSGSGKGIRAPLYPRAEHARHSDQNRGNRDRGPGRDRKQASRDGAKGGAECSVTSARWRTSTSPAGNRPAAGDRWSGTAGAAAVPSGPVFQQPVCVLRTAAGPDQGAAAGGRRIRAAVQTGGRGRVPVATGPTGDAKNSVGKKLSQRAKYKYKHRRKM